MLVFIVALLFDCYN